MSDDNDLAGKTLYAVTVRRESFCTLYVYGATEADAREDAFEMVDAEPASEWSSGDDDEIESVDRATSLPEGKTAWSGGPDGREVQAWEVLS